MWSNAGMANRQGDVDLRFEQVDVPQLTLCLGLAAAAASTVDRLLMMGIRMPETC